MTPHLLVHVPHSSTAIPEAFRKTFLVPPEELRRELLCMTDRYTQVLFGADPADMLVFPFSRLICDVERFEDEALEPMAKIGMGVSYTRGSRLQPLRSRTLLPLVQALYRRHHASLELLVAQRLSACGRCLIVDGHSFAGAPLPYEIASGAPYALRPDICIGADAFHTPAALIAASADFFTSKGLGVSVNAPFAGALVPLSRYRRDRRVASVMVEVNRRLYMDETTGAALPAFPWVRRVLQEFLLIAARFRMELQA